MIGKWLCIVLLTLHATSTIRGDDEQSDVAKRYTRPDSRWRAYGFRWFDRMDDPTYREYKYGFPPGAYGSSLIPTSLWFQIWCESPTSNMFLESKNVHLIHLDYLTFLNSCNESAQPRCSWHLFVSLLHPSAYNADFLDLLFPNRSKYATAGCYPVPIVSGSCYPFTTVDQVSLAYIYAACHFLNNETHPGLKLPLLCPNPCARRPCKQIDNAIIGSCESYGYHANDFTCKCEDGYDWESSTLTCTVDDNCQKLCHKENTLNCIVNRTSATSLCRCKDGFMGFDCSQKFDACVLGHAPDARGLNVGPIVPSGYDACGTTLDAQNLCFTVENTTKYICVCSPAYVRDISLPYDNCLKPLDSCDKRICIHGQCVTSPDLLTSICDCDDGYSGSLCDQPIGVWSQWSEWGVCEPPCGPARHRRRLRMCMSDNEGDCIGPVEEVRRCAETKGCVQDVAVEEETWMDFVDWTNYTMMVTLGYIGCLAIFLSLLGIFRRYRPVVRDESGLDSKGQKQPLVAQGGIDKKR